MAFTRQDAQAMLDALEQTMTARTNSFVMGERQPIKDAIDAHNREIIAHRVGPRTPNSA